LSNKQPNKRDRVKNAYNTMYKIKKSKIIRDIWRDAYEDDYPKEFDYDSFVTMTDLRDIVKYLNVGPNETFIDVGCGRGGPGMWIAREIGADYVGIDLSDIALEFAEQHAIQFGLEDKVSFQVGNICETSFTDNLFDGAISIDTLTFVPDKLGAICEVARILRPAASFVFTTWEQKKPNKFNDYRLLLSNAGFKVDLYKETLDWERRQRKVYQTILDSKDILIKDMGEEGSRPWIREAQRGFPTLKYLKRILVVAKKS